LLCAYIKMTETNDKPIILASRSPRRSVLLREAGIAFEAVPPKYQEPDPAGWQLGPEAYAESVSQSKALSVAGDYPDRVILGADTIVALGNEIVGKPADLDDARTILQKLFGTTHQVMTGVTIYQPAAQRCITRHAVTTATMRAMSDEELNAYLAGGEWKHKAGAYGIQDSGDAFVTIAKGSFSNVVGLPVELVLDMLAEFGIGRNRAGEGARCGT
jgi:septum formation protein